jgi:transmembrane sensor
MNYPMSDEYKIIGKIMATYPDISDEDRQILNEWLGKDGQNKNFFESAIDSEQRLRDFKRYCQVQSETTNAWGRFQNVLSEPLPKGKIHWWARWSIYVAAASIIVVILVGLKWFDKSNSRVKTIPVASTNKDVAPGQYKAKLTLDDGTTIILDSAKDGKLVQQGDMIVLTRDGKLVYEKHGETNKVLYNTLSTSKAQTYATVLSDGTKVWLNASSTIRYPVAFTADVRKVEVTGEAYFEVAPSIGKNGKRPFIVEANGMEVEVLGTHFNINSYLEEEAIKTTLLEGKVKVRSTNTNEQTILVPGEQAIIGQLQDEKVKLDKRKDVDVDAEVAWRFGYFNFNNVDLQTMMRQLQRWYDVTVEYQGEVPDIKFFGEIPRELSLSQVLNGLQRPDIHFKMVGQKIIVTR